MTTRNRDQNGLLASKCFGKTECHFIIQIDSVENIAGLQLRHEF